MTINLKIMAITAQFRKNADIAQLQFKICKKINQPRPLSDITDNLY